jgi:hypothetical protein
LDSISYEPLRQQVLRRDDWRCQSCGAMSKIEVHHQELRSHSGADSEENLITLRSACHRRMQGRHALKGVLDHSAKRQHCRCCSNTLDDLLDRSSCPSASATFDPAENRPSWSMTFQDTALGSAAPAPRSSSVSGLRSSHFHNA